MPEKITKKMNIGEVIQKYPETAEVFFKYGFHCIGCAFAGAESIEQGALSHGIDVEKFVEDLNKKISKKVKKEKKSSAPS